MSTNAVKKSCYKKEEFYQDDLNYLDLIDTEYKHIIASNFAKHCKGEEVKPLELTLVSKEGKRVETLLITKLIKYGKETAILGTSVDISERLKKESELRQERDKLEAVTRTTGVGLSMIGPDFQVLWINRVLEEHFGDVKGQKCYSAFHSRNIPCVDCGVKRIFQEGAPHVSCEMRVEYSDGRKETVEITAVPFKNDKGQVVAALETWVDITERKKAEEELRESEANYRNLINGMNETAWVFDFNGNFVEVNDAAVKTLGYSREEFLTMELKDIDKAYGKEEFKNHLKSMPAVGTKVFERVHTARDGTEIPVEISSSLITYHGEQAKLSIARNITERKRAEEALKESEEMFSKAFQSSPAMLTITRVSDNRIIDINDAFLNLFGFAR